MLTVVTETEFLELNLCNSTVNTESCSLPWLTWTGHLQLAPVHLKIIFFSFLSFCHPLSHATRPGTVCQQTVADVGSHQIESHRTSSK